MKWTRESVVAAIKSKNTDKLLADLNTSLVTTGTVRSIFPAKGWEYLWLTNVHGDQYERRLSSVVEFANMGAKSRKGSDSPWVKCSERMPEDGGFTKIYLVWGKKVGAVDMCHYHNNAWYLVSGLDTLTEYNPGIITHWMPLPEPPESE